MTGKQMKRFRESLPLSQEQFGERLGIGSPQVAISQFENGERPISKRLQKSIESWKKNISLEKRLSKNAAGGTK